MPRVDPHPLARAGNTEFLILDSTKPDLNGLIMRVKPVIMANSMSSALGLIVKKGKQIRSKFYQI